MRIAVLAGGLSPERNVSLSSGALVCQALRSRGHEVALIDLFLGTQSFSGLPEELFRAPIPEEFRRVSRKPPDLEALRRSRKLDSNSVFGQDVLAVCSMAEVVFLALHGSCGEDGRVQAALDLLGIPYTGSGYLGSALAMDKNLTKRLTAPLLASLGVRTPEWKRVNLCSEQEIDGLVQSTPLPCVVKPVDSGSSVGVYIARTEEELRQALTAGLALGGRLLLEEYIAGREVQVAVLNDRALPSIEIVPKTGFYDYENKYQPGAAEEICPAPITAEAEQLLGRAALTVFRELGLQVYARADFILAADDTVYFLEINTLPGMTPTSLVPQEAAAVGISYEELCELILTASLEARKQGRS